MDRDKQTVQRQMQDVIVLVEHFKVMTAESVDEIISRHSFANHDR